MSIEKEIEYKHGDVTLKGYFVSKDETPKPCVIVSHAWGGRDQFSMDKAKAMTELGYSAFALDMYGGAKLGANNDECTGLMTPFVEERNFLRDRVLAAVSCVKDIKEVDSNKIAAIGFCFGGMCVLDLARSGADLKGVVSFHGLLGAPPVTEKITTKILVLHGYDDPMAKPDQLITFANEMTEAKADWQIHAYGNTVHAFTNPVANDTDFGTVYKKAADQRSWQAMVNFLEEIF